MNKIKVGVIGVGYLGAFHAQTYAQLENAQLMGVHDINPERAREIGLKLNVPCFPDVRSLIDCAEALSIVVPTTAHFAIARECIAAGRHVLIEKPITSTIAEADALIDLARTKNVLLQVGHIERFNPAITGLERFSINPRFIESHRLATFNPRGTDVAVVLDLMIHDIDLCLYFVKSPLVSIEAVGVPVISQTEDIANARLKFKNGCIANITASRISLNKMRKMRIFQENAYLSLDLLKHEADIFQLLGEQQTPAPAALVVASLEGKEKKGKITCEAIRDTLPQPLTAELSSFLQSVSAKTTPLVTGEDGRKALEVALTIIEQIKKG
jgi:predicted dehydrogenase